jgi:fructokinase
MNTPPFGLIEAGGTKIVLGVAQGRDAISATTRIPTTTPEETLGAVIGWFRAQSPAYRAIGVASFGPLSLDRTAKDWGHITRTTKPHWSHTDVAGPLAAAFGCPIGFDTDVNGAALAEARWGAGVDAGGLPLKSVLYLTIGTGIGGGLVVNGAPLSGLSHPEMGHIRMPRHPLDQDFAGSCPFHGDCLEGLASGPAIVARWGASLSELPAEHRGHEIIAWYMGQAICTFQAVFEPARIILGGGVMGTPGLIARIQDEAQRAGKGYFVGQAKDIVTVPGLGDQAGLLGALALAMDQL